MPTIDVPMALALPGNIDVYNIEQSTTTLTITAMSRQVAPSCPRCGTPAARVHSHYTRQIADLPCGGMSTRLRIQVRKYFCEDRACVQKIFTERLAPFIEPWARVTARLTQVVQALGLATGYSLLLHQTNDSLFTCDLDHFCGDRRQRVDLHSTFFLELVSSGESTSGPISL